MKKFAIAIIKLIAVVIAWSIFTNGSGAFGQNIQPPQYQEQWSNGEWKTILLHKNFVYNQALGRWVYAPEYTAGVIRVNHDTNGARLNWENIYSGGSRGYGKKKFEPVKPSRTEKEKEILEKQGRKALVEYINNNLTR